MARRNDPMGPIFGLVCLALVCGWCGNGIGCFGGSAKTPVENQAAQSFYSPPPQETRPKNAVEQYYEDHKADIEAQSKKYESLQRNDTYQGDQSYSRSSEETDIVPAGATAQCNDGTYSFSRSRRGTCSHHNGVARWL